MRDITGEKFGRLTVLEYTNKHGKPLCICECECINRTKKTINAYSLILGKTKSCGCYSREINTTHGLTKHYLYSTWTSMLDRCRNPESKHYKDYGGRGILVCKKWEDVREFVKDVEPLYIKGLTLDRINNNGDYEPGNVRYITKKEQNNNKRNNVLVEYKGKTQTLAQWCDELKMHRMTFWNRLFRDKWSVGEAIETLTHTLIEFNGKSQTAKQWSKETNISHKTIYERLHLRKWTIEKTLTTPTEDQLIEYNGKSQTIRQWSNELGIKYATIWTRLFAYKWPVEKTLSTPLRKSLTLITS